LALFAVAGMLFVAGAAIAVVLDKGAAWRFSPQTLAQIEVADDEARHYSRCLSSFETWIDPRQACQLGDASAQPSVLLWGDSHAMVTATAMVAAARRQKASFLFAADADCPTGINFSVDPSVTPAMTTQGHYRRCGEYNRGMLDLALRSPQIRTVVLSSRWTGWRVGEPANPAEKPVDIRLRDDGGMASSVGANRAKFERGFAQLVDALRAAGKRVVIVGPLPEPRYNVPHRLYVSRFGFVDKPAPIALTDYRRRHAVIIGYFNGLELGPNVSFIWPAAVLCTGMQCPTVKDGMPQFLDHNHLSVGAALDTSRLYDWIFEGGGSAP
jgi:hypothetical protein